MMSDGVPSHECPRCSDEEMWEHDAQCRITAHIREEFVLELHEDLKKVQTERSSDEESQSFTEDTRKHLRKDEEDTETN